ncbi:hypothetical protein B7494_g8350 [Chlorociboria aeruginascens]|nr:hypothetical protein B7494_g8350 [Chlorociboria aeruginascens]
MPLRSLLKKNKKKEAKVAERDVSPEADPDFTSPTFTFMRSDTLTQEIISPPTFSSTESSNPASSAEPEHESRSRSLFNPRSRKSSVASVSSEHNSERPSSGKRLSERLHLRRNGSSTHVPIDLPDITGGVETDDRDGKESQWEKRATILAMQNEKSRSRPNSAGSSTAALGSFHNLNMGGQDRGVVSSKQLDDNIQEAIRLHEAGELETSTHMFGRLADPNGENNALSQVLYGLALRHGWGCTPDPAKAVTYLSAAASNAASIEELALQAGMKKGGAAKGELVLAIFELANCFRHGWGVEKDAVAAQRYYETAANLGDTDAMNEVAWCYSEGFGCKKDRSRSDEADVEWQYAAAKYYRLAEAGGNKTLGNSWIWKEKYNEPKK